MSASAVRTSLLNSGFKIPQVGYGTWQAAPGVVGPAVTTAIKAGYLHLDLAKVYQNQREVGEGIRNAGKAFVRDQMFITSKLWNSSHKPEHVEPALDDTLAELGLDYLDLWLIHWPVPFVAVDPPTKNLFPRSSEDKGLIALDPTVGVVDTWRAMVKLLDTGKVRSIGVSNFSLAAIDAIIEATGVVPAVHQFERHPLLVQRDIVKHHAEKGIHITAYSPLGNNNEGKPLLFEHPAIIEIANRIPNATPAQVLISWGAIGGHSVIPKSVTPARIISNLEHVELSAADVKIIESLGEGDKRARFNIPIKYRPKWDINVYGEKEELGAKAVVRIHSVSAKM